ncbi:uncharacterized protein LOC142238221 [Haematobia irritans]|uniref:uncharacterized protein LOC142238221 n=1 Tax=Haematobia irritans TaxID=7368 RepID=UPI003F507930
MPVLDVLCPICTELFKNVEDIYSTNCGHIFHYSCLSAWQNRSAECPQCRHPNPTTHKIFLSFEGSSESFAEIQNKLEQISKELSDCKCSLAEKSLLLVNLRSENLKLIEESKKHTENISNKDVLLNDYEIEIKKLEEEISQLDETIRNKNVLLRDSRAEFANEIAEIERRLKIAEEKLNGENFVNESLDSSASTNDSATNVTSLLECSTQSDLCPEIETLQERLKQLQDQYDKTVAKNNDLTLECIRLKAAKSSDKSSGNVDYTIDEDNDHVIKLKEKNKVLETKLMHISSQFSKEIAKSTQLEIDKIKLQTYIDHLKLDSIRHHEESPITNDAEKLKKFTSSESLNSRDGSKRRNKRCSISSLDNSTANSIVIQYYPSQQLIYPLERTVIKVAEVIHVPIKSNDIAKVNIVCHSAKNFKGLVSIFVQFNYRDIKNNFLKNKSYLGQSDTLFLRPVMIKEYFDQKIQELFVYAKGKLLGKGFADIFLTNNQIFAKRNVSDAIGIKIQTKAQVDDLSKDPCALNSLI